MILIVLVVFSTGGVTIFRHTCEGVVIRTTFDHPAPCCSMPCHHCRDKAVNYKIHDDFATSSREVVPGNGTPLPISVVIFEVGHQDLAPGLHPDQTFLHSPPVRDGSSRNKAALLQIFQI